MQNKQSDIIFNMIASIIPLLNKLGETNDYLVKLSATQPAFTESEAELICNLSKKIETTLRAIVDLEESARSLHIIATRQFN